MASNKQLSAIVLVASVLSIGFASAKPYYFFHEVPVPQPIQQAAENVANHAQQKGEQVGEQLPQRIQGHLGQLYSHSSSAVKSLADSVQPDIKNIGQDITDAYHVTRDNVGKRIEPLAQTVKPYIENAQKAVAPYVDQAREEVPKLINKAAPAIQKVGETVRQSISGVWGRLASSAGQQGEAAAANGEQAIAKVEQAAQQMASAAVPPKQA